jgi:hypothetical protein
MANLGSTPPFSKKIDAGIAENIRNEKNARIAHDALRDLMLFNNSLESELKNMTLAMANGTADQELYIKMTAAKEKYNYAMSGLRALDDHMERAAFIALADAIQDLMAYIHKRRH